MTDCTCDNGGSAGCPTHDALDDYGTPEMRTCEITLRVHYDATRVNAPLYWNWTDLTGEVTEVISQLDVPAEVTP